MILPHQASQAPCGFSRSLGSVSYHRLPHQAMRTPLGSCLPCVGPWHTISCFTKPYARRLAPADLVTWPWHVQGWQRRQVRSQKRSWSLRSLPLASEAQRRLQSVGLKPAFKQETREIELGKDGVCLWILKRREHCNPWVWDMQQGRKKGVMSALFLQSGYCRWYVCARKGC